MFRFSEYTEHPAELLFWLQWFQQRGIPAGIIQEDDRFSLWRDGEEKLSYEAPQDELSKRATILLGVNDFKAKWAEKRSKDNAGSIKKTTESDGARRAPS